MKKITLITGGSRSGKSGFALLKAMDYNNRAFIATAVPFDREMKKRIAKHKAERKEQFTTLEEPYNLANALEQINNKIEVVVIDCITVWLGNLFFKHGENKNEFEEINLFFNSIAKSEYDLIIVTNEVGMGIIPENGLARNYRDLAGFVNQKLAKVADEVILMISGIPVKIKG